MKKESLQTWRANLARMRKRYRIRSYLQQVEQAKIEAEFEAEFKELYEFKTHYFDALVEREEQA